MKVVGRVASSVCVQSRRFGRGWLVASGCLLAVLVIGTARAAVPAPTGYTSFSVYITSAYYWSYSSTLDVRASAYYRDSGCTPSYQCDRDVLGEFKLVRGYSSYGPVVGRAVSETGQYGATLKAAFRLPSCRYIPRYKSVTYTVVLTAAAPNGDEKRATRAVYVRSCGTS